MPKILFVQNSTSPRILMDDQVAHRSRKPLIATELLERYRADWKHHKKVFVGHKTFPDQDYNPENMTRCDLILDHLNADDIMRLSKCSKDQHLTI